MKKSKKKKAKVKTKKVVVKKRVKKTSSLMDKIRSVFSPKKMAVGSVNTSTATVQGDKSPPTNDLTHAKALALQKEYAQRCLQQLEGRSDTMRGMGGVYVMENNNPVFKQFNTVGEARQILNDVLNDKVRLASLI